MSINLNLKAITLENFRGFSEEVEIPLSKLNFLFGSNSSGKSSVILALQYLSHIFKTGDPDPYYLNFGGQFKEIGGFKQLIHKKNPHTQMGIGVKYGSWYIKFFIGYDFHNNSGIIQKITHYRDGELFYSVEHNGHLTIHTELIPFEEGLLEEVELHESGFDTDFPLQLNQCTEEWFYYLTYMFFNEKKSLKGFFHFSDPDLDERKGLLHIMFNNTLKKYWPEIPWFEDEEENADAFQFFMDDLHSANTEPQKLISEYLDTILHIGPLRNIPDRRSLQEERELSWYDGSYAWNVAARANDEEIRSLNKWLKSESHFNTGYSLVREVIREIPEDSELLTRIKLGTLDELTNDANELIEKFPLSLRVFLRDETLRTNVFPSEIGVGISQLLPVIVACVLPQKDCICIEQPELHLHPACQVVLGDLFLSRLEAKSGQTSLVETHSEHLILRVLRRIREANERESSEEDQVPVKPEDVSVVYFYKEDEKIKVKALEIDEEGEFKQDWPQGFFEERAEELF